MKWSEWEKLKEPYQTDEKFFAVLRPEFGVIKPCGSDPFSGNDFNTYNYNMDEILVNLWYWMVGDDDRPSIENLHLYFL